MGKGALLRMINTEASGSVHPVERRVALGRGTVWREGVLGSYKVFYFYTESCFFISADQLHVM